MAATPWALGHGSVRGALQLLAATFVASAVVTFVGWRGRRRAWVVFRAIAAATWLGRPPA